ncbi:MAG TPA: nicotinate phosphoribosyltransferase [Candidatus Ruthenibacterium merdavium]|uniref:Nicotinate phosphoribosyltransferase n=1 Tax=Candidatus Ruthenibacterium merdavium TaxID=2838752 RepID=A0A9D2TLB4_9FIRM|nr:nicotinate phosphoribosyltransferase [Candidatus Ruthenibacterium merdavium]
MTDVNQARNLTLLMDFYEMTMAAGYFEEGYEEQIGVFDMFFRKVPDDGGFAIAAGLAQFCEIIDNLHFTEEDIEYLRSKNCFSEAFLDYLRHFEFHCNIWAVEEGTPVFPMEPLVIVEGPAIEAQLIETLLLVTFNHQSLICTKTNRIVRAAKGLPVMEFGSRRAQGYDGAVLGARAAYIGGVVGTACVLADRQFGIPALGTMAHSWVQMFPSEYEAFARYAKLYPDNCTLLVDTYNVLKSGVPNAIRVFNEVLAPMGIRPKGVRIDSGDIAYLSKKVRKMLDEAGYPDCGICASNSLDEYIVRDLLVQGAKLDSFGIGENLITSKSSPVFGGVYKLAAVRSGEHYEPKIKISETAEKITIPHLKNLYRIYDNETGKAMADLMTMYDETLDASKGLTLFDPVQTWKKRTFTGIHLKQLNVPIYVNGKRVYQTPPLEEIRRHCAEQVETLWDEVKRFENPHRYYVDLSQKLWDERQRLLNELSVN